MSERESERESEGPGMWEPLRHRNFALLWAGLLVSLVGDSLQFYAQTWLIVTELAPNSGLHLGIVTVAFAAPRLLLALVAGTAADRFDRRRVLLTTQGLALLQALVFLGLLLTETITFDWVVALTFGLGVVNTLNLSARNALLPSLVPRPLIGKAVALQALGANVVTIVGPALAGVLIGLVGIDGCFIINAFTFVVALLGLLVLRTEPVPARPPRNFVADLREGVAFVASRRVLWAPTLLVYLIGLLGWPLVRLLPLHARVVLEGGSAEYGLMGTAIGVGAICASVLVTARVRHERQLGTIVGAAAVAIAALFLLAIVEWLPLVLVSLAVAGFGQMSVRSAVSIVLQLETPDELRGRVLSLQLLDGAMVSVGAIVFGAVTDELAVAFATASAPTDSEVATALLTTFGLMAGSCALVLLVLGPVILRSRLTATDEGADRDE